MPRFNDPSVTLSYLEKGDLFMGGDPTEFSNILADNLFNRSLTRVQLQSLITASSLIIGQKYTITNAVGSTLSLVVQAVAVNKLDEIAVNSANGENYKYDISADTAILISNPIALGSANQILGVNNGATAQEYKTLSGTANQVTVTHSAGGITLSLPQSIATISSPTFAGLTLASALSVANGGTGLSSTPTNGQLDIGNGTGFTRATLTGTANQVTITNASGSITLSLPQNIATTSSPTFASLTLTSPLTVANGGTGLSSSPVNGAIDIGNGTNFTRATITGTANQVTVTNGAGTITLSLPQSIATTSTPQFAGLGLGSTTLFNLQGLGTSAKRIAIQGTDVDTATSLIARFSNDTGSGLMAFVKSRGASIGTNTLVQSGDTLGNIDWYSADGSIYYRSARISAVVDNTTGVADVPAAITFLTTIDGSVSLTEAMRITSSQSLLIGTTTSVSSAKVVINSTTQGFLPPKMTTIQRDAIVSPVSGLVIYNTSTNKLNVYTTVWEAVTSA